MCFLFRVGGGKDLVFQNVNVDIAGTKILKDVSGMARKGEMLAVMGPSGLFSLVVY